MMGRRTNTTSFFRHILCIILSLNMNGKGLIRIQCVVVFFSIWRNLQLRKQDYKLVVLNLKLITLSSSFFFNSLSLSLFSFIISTHFVYHSQFGHEWKRIDQNSMCCCFFSIWRNLQLRKQDYKLVVLNLKLITLSSSFFFNSLSLSLLLYHSCYYICQRLQLMAILWFWQATVIG